MSPTDPTHPPGALTEHRKDIDGLRAIAVLGVLFYHFDLPGLTVPGGFTGVDVFFVISGYLITGILLRQRHQSGYLKDFAIRRIRRIFPALIVVIGVTVAAGYLFLIPDDYDDLAIQARYATFALSNFYFLFNTGYFDPAAEHQALLHTWSLAVEEQFYLVWPLVLLLLRRVSHQVLLLFTAAVILASLSYSHWLTVDAPKSAFYGPLSRAWELGVGALLAMTPRMRLGVGAATVIRTLGLALIAFSFFGLNSDSLFPGLNALYACAGTAMLIVPVNHPTLICRGLSLAPMQAIGLISYSLYLWHWPVLVFYEHYASTSELPLSTGLWLICLSTVLATASYRLIETPFRQRRFTTRSNVLIGTMGTMLVLLLITLIDQSGGHQQRLTPLAATLNDRHENWQWQPAVTNDMKMKESIGFGGPWRQSGFRVLIWGDSHSQQIAPIVERALQLDHQDWAGLLYWGCPAVVDGRLMHVPMRGRQYNDYCAERLAQMRQFLHDPDNRPNVIILASAWHTLTPRVVCETSDAADPVPEAVSSIIDELSSLVPDIIVLTQIPMFDYDPTACQIGAQIGLLRRPCRELTIASNGAYLQQTEALRALASDHVHVITPSDDLCTAGQCLTWLSDEFIYRDQTHIRRNLKPQTRREFGEIIGLRALLRTLH